MTAVSGAGALPDGVGAPPRRLRRLRRLGRLAGARLRQHGDWPGTTRILPWMLAAFLVMLWLTPFDSIQGRIGSAIDPKLDRLVLLVMALALVVSLLAGRRATTRPPALIAVALVGFTAVAFASVAVNLGTLTVLGQVELTTKKLAVLLSYGFIFFFVTTVVRPSEARRFLLLAVGLAVLTAIGTIYEYRSGANVFFDWSRSLFSGPFAVGAPLPDSEFERPSITGPTTLGLTLTTILALVLPFAAVEYTRSRTNGRRLVMAIATGLLLAACFATLKKSAGVVPLVALGVLLLYRPRATLKLAPLLVVLVFFVQAVVPGALMSVKAQLLGSERFSQTTTDDRLADYPATVPDLAMKPALGRGFGSYDPDAFRVLDNQWLLLAVETGVVGVATFLLLLVAALVISHRLARERHSTPGAAAAATVASVVAFGVACALFDALSFPQAPYVFLTLVALTTVLGQLEDGPASESRRVRVRRAAARVLQTPRG
jgi:hypothetical protein